MKKLWLLLMLCASPALAGETTLFGRIYLEPWSTLSGVPAQNKPMLSEFGVRHEGTGRLRLTGAVETMMIRHEGGQRIISSVFYRIGCIFSVTPILAIEASHGSWHNIDRPGPSETYNRVGLEMKL